MKNHQTELTENEELCDLYRKKAEELVSQMTIEELADQTLNSAPPIERLNIKGYDWWNEGLHGVARAGTATVFPQAIGLAAAFDEDLMDLTTGLDLFLAITFYLSHLTIHVYDKFLALLGIV